MKILGWILLAPLSWWGWYDYLMRLPKKSDDIYVIMSGAILATAFTLATYGVLILLGVI